jgi:hypothetical protein
VCQQRRSPIRAGNTEHQRRFSGFEIILICLPTFEQWRIDKKCQAWQSRYGGASAVVSHHLHFDEVFGEKHVNSAEQLQNALMYKV